MKTINYKMNGKIVQLEVSDKVAEQYHEIVKEEDRVRIARIRHESRFSVEEYEELTGNEIASDELSPEEKLLESEEKKENKCKLQAALTSLLPEQKELVTLVYVKNMSLKDIAEKYGISYQAVQNRMEKILKKLKKYFS